MKKRAAPASPDERIVTNAEATLVTEGILENLPAGRVNVSPVRTRAARRTRVLAQPPPNLADERILTTAELVERVPLTRQTIWRMVREGRFPAPISLTRSRIGWKLSAVLAWIAEREAHPIRRRKYFVTEDLESERSDSRRQ